MMIRQFVTQMATLSLGILLITGCASTEVLTEEERAKQDQVDSLVASALFEADLDTEASYNIRKDGVVMISFAESAKFEEYNNVVESLRANPAIGGIYAEQSGAEVCPFVRLK